MVKSSSLFIVSFMLLFLCGISAYLLVNEKKAPCKPANLKFLTVSAVVCGLVGGGLLAFTMFTLDSHGSSSSSAFDWFSSSYFPDSYENENRGGGPAPIVINNGGGRNNSVRDY